MSLLDTLDQEHRLIEAVLDALDICVSSTSAQPGELVDFVEFLSQFADRAHHGKEEDILFDALIQHGFPRESGPVAVMLAEHDTGRDRLLRLRSFSELPHSPSAEERLELQQVASAYTELLRNHIRKEDTVLYPMARAQLPNHVWKMLDARAAEIEEELFEDKQRLRERASRLVQHYRGARAGSGGT